MLNDLPSATQIASLTEGLLQRADAAGRWPTPVDDIVAATDLTEPASNPLSPSILARAPKQLRNAIKAIGAGKIRALLDRRERTVYVDPSVEHEGRRSFLRLHETCHELFPWQQELAYADSDLTLSPSTWRLFEREANQGSAELMFQRERFATMAADYAINMGAVMELAGTVGASLRATLRRYAETHRRPVCGIVLEASPVSFTPLTWRRKEVSMSPAWVERFGSTWPAQLSVAEFEFLKAIGTAHVADDLVFPWPDLDNQPVGIRAQAHSSRHAVLVLLWAPRRERLKIKRVAGIAA